MIIIDKKNAMTSIMSKRHPKDGTSSSAPMAAEKSMNADGEPDGRHAAAQDVLSAMNEKSPQKLMEALAAFHDLHAMHSQKNDAEPDVPEQPDSES